MEYKKFGDTIVNGYGAYGTGQVKLKDNSSFIVCGRTGSGKTTFINRLLSNAEIMFENKNKRDIEILYCYKAHQELFDKMEDNLKIKFVSGLPDSELISCILKPERKHLIIVLDDLMREVVSSNVIVDFFTIKAHHLGTSLIYVSHNLYEQGKHSRTIILNASYFCLFENVRGIDQIYTMSKQMYAGQNNAIVQAYNMAMKVQDFSYLFIDMTPNVPQALRMRTCIFPNEATRFYVPEESV